MVSKRAVEVGERRTSTEMGVNEWIRTRQLKNRLWTGHTRDD